MGFRLEFPRCRQLINTFTRGGFFLFGFSGSGFRRYFYQLIGHAKKNFERTLIYDAVRRVTCTPRLPKNVKVKSPVNHFSPVFSGLPKWFSRVSANNRPNSQRIYRRSMLYERLFSALVDGSLLLDSDCSE